MLPLCTYHYNRLAVADASHSDCEHKLQAAETAAATQVSSLEAALCTAQLAVAAATDAAAAAQVAHDARVAELVQDVISRDTAIR
jgi:hypothetical protein